VVTNKYNK